MQPLGTRAVEVETLEQRIERRLNEALDRQIAGGFYPSSERGLVDASEVPVWDNVGPVRVSLADVARIAAQEAKAWF